nr:hypothetical protein Iba_chr10cCG4030 [Ipomoea batatas]
MVTAAQSMLAMAAVGRGGGDVRCQRGDPRSPSSQLRRKVGLLPSDLFAVTRGGDEVQHATVALCLPKGGTTE